MIVAAAPKGISRGTGLIGPSRQQVGRQLELPLGLEGAQPDEMPVPAHPSHLALGHEGKPVLLALPEDLAIELNPPGAVRRGVVAELRERDPDLGGPAERVHPGPALPYRVPREVFLAPLGRGAEDAVQGGATGRHPEAHAAQMIVKGVQVDIELVGLDVLIPPGERRLDPARLPVVEPCTYIDRVVTDQHPHLGPLGGRPALRRLGLGKVARRLGLGPRGLIEPAIQCDGALDPGGRDRRRGGMPAGGRRVARGGGWILRGGNEGKGERGGQYAGHRSPGVRVSDRKLGRARRAKSCKGERAVRRYGGTREALRLRSGHVALGMRCRTYFPSARPPA